MSEDIRALNRSLDHQCEKLIQDQAKLTTLLEEERNLKERLAIVTKQIAKTEAVIACRKRDVAILFEQIPLTQLSPIVSPCSADQEKETDETPYITQSSDIRNLSPSDS